MNKIIFTEHAMKERRLFPVSKHRSRRIHKKLLKRFGAETVREPAIYRFNGDWLIHPSFERDLIRQTIQEPHRPKADNPLVEGALWPRWGGMPLVNARWPLWNTNVA